MFKATYLSLILLLLLYGCESSVYYSQAVVGQLKLLNNRQDIDDILAQEDTEALLRDRLQQVKDVRLFSEKNLLLPVGDSYSAYVDLGRNYVVWNVFAAGELSLSSKRWCFPIAGCVAYRGYFSEQPALDKAEALKKQNYDVYVGGVRAYSTLGWFDDPVLNTFINKQTLDLVVLLFHELAHRKIYIQDDTAFNESFATAVADIGLALWLKEHADQQEQYQAYLHQREISQAFKALLAKYREKLLVIYADKSLSDDEKRDEKKATFALLTAEYQNTFRPQFNTNAYSNWMKTVNNAKLANVANYNVYVPAFIALYHQHDSLEGFYQAVERIGELDMAQRHERLESLMPSAVKL